MHSDRRGFIIAAAGIGSGAALVEDVLGKELARRGVFDDEWPEKLDDRAAAVQHIRTAKAIHEAWIELLEDPEKLARRVPHADASDLARAIGNVEYHHIWVHRYERVLSVLTKGRDL